MSATQPPEIRDGFTSWLCQRIFHLESRVAVLERRNAALTTVASLILIVLIAVQIALEFIHW